MNQGQNPENVQVAIVRDLTNIRKDVIRSTTVKDVNYDK